MSNLTDKQHLAALYLAQGMKGCDVAKALEVTPETVSKWRRNPAFQELCASTRGSIINESLDRVRGLHAEAIDTLARLMKDGNSELVQFRAAQTVLKYGNMMNPESLIWSMNDIF